MSWLNSMLGLLIAWLKAQYQLLKRMQWMRSVRGLHILHILQVLHISNNTSNTCCPDVQGLYALRRLCGKCAG